MTASPRADTRSRLLAAAAAEFAARGFDGANIDRIARAARVNKAMIYYHFRNKAALYREILRNLFAAVGTAVAAVAASPRPPADKLAGFVQTVAAELQAHPHFPPIWLRELAEGGRHLDADVVRAVARVPALLGEILAEGRVAGVFRDVNLLLLHFGIVGPLAVYFASDRMRQRVARLAPALADLSALSVEDVTAQVERIAFGVVSPGDAQRPSRRPGAAGGIRPIKRRARARER